MVKQIDENIKNEIRANFSLYITNNLHRNLDADLWLAVYNGIISDLREQLFWELNPEIANELVNNS